MKRFRHAKDISPEEFELQVKKWLESTGAKLESFTASHRELICGMDGEYEIDVAIRFTAFAGAEFLMLVECKKHKNAIERAVVQALKQKQLSLGAHKAMIVSTSEFQSGAIEFALAHGIALVRLISGIAMYIRGSSSDKTEFDPIPDDADDYAGIFYGLAPGLMPQPFNSHKNYGFADYVSKNEP